MGGWEGLIIIIYLFDLGFFCLCFVFVFFLCLFWVFFSNLYSKHVFIELSL